MLYGNYLIAGYFLIHYRRAFLGPVQHKVVATSVDLLPRELGLVLILSALLLITGLYPSFILDITQSASENWLQHVRGH